ncbi:hypothetical protein DMO17_02555 [Aquipseudomonas alcaligenes]|uniref:Uncharacterized protein n=1 Tax=Aquipseudomonas alcaligenes TaxID=43263 RepID=A0A2V4MHT1_AQUAC|nr:hypothetical protein [Pseudomonas alcaligenes]PYC29596.1 hypothetical protein DMO17_02555 [Pseudomonas alcaligenes]
MEILIAAAALAIAWWQLDLQRKEIQRSGKINALVNMSQMVRERIELYSDIIDSLKNEKKPWKGHADKINRELRPLLSKINQEIIIASSNYNFSFPEKEIIAALNLKEITEIDIIQNQA